MSYDVSVIGAGPGGYSAAIRASQLGLKTNVFEIAENLTVAVSELFKRHNIDVIKEKIKLQDSNKIRAGNKLYEAKSIIITSGSEPVGLPFLPFDKNRVLSVTDARTLKKVPKSILIVGGGADGVEFGSYYSRLGCDVTIIEMMPQICTDIDRTLTSALFDLLNKQKIKFMMNTQVLAAKDYGKNGLELKISEESGEEVFVRGEVVLVALGHHPRSQDLGITHLNIDTTPRGAIVVDSHFRTTISNIYAIGDLIDRPRLAQRAFYEGIAVAEVIAGLNPKFDYTKIPNVIYSSPELATVGLSEEEAGALKCPLKIGKCSFINNPLSRKEDVNGLVKIIANAKTDQILGLHILSNHASEMIEVGMIALHNHYTLSELGNLPFAHLTFSEAIKEAALQALGRSYYF